MNRLNAAGQPDKAGKKESVSGSKPYREEVYFEPGITRCMVVFEETEIGYIQFYLISEAERIENEYSGFIGSIYGLDQFIGEPDYWNRGIGTELIAGTVHYLLKELNASKIVMDPRTDNLRAVRVYEKNGFVKKKRLPAHEWHEGELRDCWLMEYEGE